jgi:hypothetical protein
MTIAVFDTLKLARRLEKAGMPAPQAEGFAEALSDVMTTELATKSDLKDLRGWATAEFADVRGEMRAEFADIRGEMRAEFADIRREMRTGFAEVRTEFARLRMEMAQSKTETIRWMVGLFVAQISITLGVLLRLAG